jgi:ADP-ribose pyrophosphatase YjhB (NUDIX family)
MLTMIPNHHPKKPNLLARTPNVAADNLCLFQVEGKIYTVLGLFQKEVKTIGSSTTSMMKGYTLSGGHVEYKEDHDIRRCAFRELEEEFKIEREDIVESMAVGVFDDAFRDKRNRYISLVMAHWINAVPKPSDEHKKIKVIEINTLIKLIESGQAIEEDPITKEGLKLLHGHDSMLYALFTQCPAVQDMCKRISESQ